MRLNRRKELMKLPKERLVDFIEMASRNFWTLQNNWMINVESRFGREVAVELDALCYGRAAEVQVYRLKNFLNLGDDMPSLARAILLSISSFYVDIEFPEISERKVVRRVAVCPMQLERRRKGLPELPCKPALVSAYTKVAAAVNPKIKITHVLCPPDPHPEDLWCDVVFELKD